MSDREMDALVAEKLFGWRWVKYPAPNDPDKVLTAIIPPDAPDRVWPNGYDRIWQTSDAGAPRFSRWDDMMWWDDGAGCHGLPHYSTDIADAFDVVDRMHALGYVLSLYSGCLPPLRPWVAVFDQSVAPAWTTSGDWGRPLPTHETPARGICIEALRALGVEVPDD